MTNAIKPTHYDRLRARREFAVPRRFPLYAYHKLAEELWRTDYIYDYGEVENPLGKAIVIEHIRPFYRPPDRFDPRPGRWSKDKNVGLLNELGYKVDLHSISDPTPEPDDFDQYDLLFGSGSKFNTFAKRMPDDATVIYYSGSCHHDQIAEAYRERLDAFETRHSVALNPERPGFLKENIDFEPIDAIIAMGDSFTKRTYSARVDLPVHTVHTTHNPDIGRDDIHRNHESARRNFLWFAGTGPILKGLDLVLDVFSELSDLDLYLVGPYDNHEEFIEHYAGVIDSSNNIHPMGYVDTRSPLFDKLVNTCAFQIYPSASEGSSGAVAACTWRGLVPIVTEPVFEATGDWGISLQDPRVDTIIETVQESAEMPPQAVQRMSYDAQEMAHKRYDRTRYTNHMQNVLTGIFDSLNIPFHGSSAGTPG